MIFNSYFITESAIKWSHATYFKNIIMGKQLIYLWSINTQAFKSIVKNLHKTNGTTEDSYDH